jgi:hypothetical protein
MGGNHVGEKVEVEDVAEVADVATGEAEAAEAAADPIAEAVRQELDHVLPHGVTALKRQEAVADLSRRLDDAERRLAEREGRPMAAGVRRVLTMVRRLDFDPEAREAIASELEKVMVGAGYEEFGEVGETFDPARHEVIEGRAEGGVAVVAELFEPGLEALGDVLARAKIRVGTAEEE